MAHPENAYAFNEHSLACCETQQGCASLASLLDVARAWRLHESSPLVERLKVTPGFDDLKRSSRYRDKLVVLLDSAVNRQPLYKHAHERLRWPGAVARGMTVAHALGGFVLSWPCGCAWWKEELIEAASDLNSNLVSCRHVGSEEHLRLHWMRATKAAKQRTGRPKAVQRIDNAQNPAAGEVPQIHFKDGSALNIDGAWKHGSRVLNGAERDWLAQVGWVLPDPPVEVR